MEKQVEENPNERRQRIEKSWRNSSQPWEDKMLWRNGERKEQQMKNLRLTVVMAVLATFLVQVIVPSYAEAGWRSHYDDMPGEDVDVGKILLIGAGVAAAAVVIALAVKSSKINEANKEDTNTSDDRESEVPDEASLDKSRVNKSLGGMKFKSAYSPYYSLYLDFDRGDRISKMENNDLGLSNVMLKAGLSYNF
jgi:hypothetical protein